MSGVLLDTGSMSPTIVANIVIDSIMATPKKLVALLYSYSNSIGGVKIYMGWVIRNILIYSMYCSNAFIAKHKTDLIVKNKQCF